MSERIKNLGIRFALLAVLGLGLLACSGSQAVSADGNRLVVVAGATGGTGRALVSSLLDEGYTVRALVRDEPRARIVLGDKVEYVEADVRDYASLEPVVAGARYLISAIGSTRSDPENSPEAVDFGGVRNLALAAADAGVAQFVLVSSAGVTQEDHFLNKAFDNVLIWKFRGEEALRESGVPYTIVRPGGLVNTPGGIEALVFAQGDTTAGRISREDVALICVAALGLPEAINKSFETYSSETAGANDWTEMFAALERD